MQGAARIAAPFADAKENIMHDRICAALGLGELVDSCVLTGGYTHRMVALTTTQGRYAVKLLNPEIMARPGVTDNFARAESFERRLEAAGLPILPAKTIGGRKMQQVDGQYLYVFDCFDGRALAESAIAPAHCAKMGDALARIHAIDHREGPAPDVPAPIDWAALADALLKDGEAHGDGLLLQCAIPLLTAVEAAANDAIRRLPRIQTICHWDMDSKNVLWQEDDFRIIDLECLDWGDPHQEMMDLAISWGGWPLQEANFKAFVTAYRNAGGNLPNDPAAVLQSRRNHIDWLAYNARRALFDDAQERAVGRSQIGETLAKIRSDGENLPRVLRWMREIS